MSQIQTMNGSITKEYLDQHIDLKDLSYFISDPEAKRYFLLESGQEHYKLLAYLSLRWNNIKISDIGTYKGASAIALSINPTNQVKSYDVQNVRMLTAIPDNVEFILYNKPFSADILESKIIFLDTMHDGIQEQLVIEFLQFHKWKGLLVMDDIHHFPALKSLWDSIHLPKEDLTHLGHWSGTGIVYFE